MKLNLTRRAMLMTGAAAMLAASLTAGRSAAQDKPTLRFSAVFSDQDIRARMMERFAEGVADLAVMEMHYGGTLFGQGTELVALQRGNLEMGNIAPQDIANQIPAWSILTSAYLFRDPAHLQAFFASDAGAEMKAMAEENRRLKRMYADVSMQNDLLKEALGKSDTASPTPWSLRERGGETRCQYCAGLPHL